jgi:hypothetical protein
VVQSASGKTFQLTDGKLTLGRNKVFLVPHNTVITTGTERNVIKVATQHWHKKDKELFNRVNIKQANVIEGGRAARPG